MVFFNFFCDISRRIRRVLWILVILLHTFDPCSFLDSDGCVFLSFTPASSKGLRFSLFEMAAKERCCVPGCGSQNHILHKFPHPEKEPDRFRTWLYAVGGDLLSLDNNYIHKYRSICHLHFEPSYYTWSKRLARNAIPTLNLPGIFVKRQPMAEVTNLAIASTSSAKKNTTAVSSTLVEKEPQQEGTVIPKTKSDEPQQESTVEPNCSVENKAEIEKPKMYLKRGASKTTTASKEVLQLKRNIKKLTKSNDSYRIRLKKALKLFQNTTFQKALKKFTTVAAIFTVLQFKQIGKPKMSRKYTKEEKIMALSVYKLGPKAYKWLSKFFVLPSPVTLSRMISRANLKPGVNKSIFQQLKKKVEKMSDDDKLCSLIFDEMALTPHLEYNRRIDKIVGFVDDGSETKQKFADHVLVFMIRGITKNYKQPIHYTFCSGSTQKVVLAKLIKDVIQKLQEIGLEVLTTVCDQGTSNISAINYLIEETRQEYLKKNQILRNNIFEINGKTIIPLFDVPHLLKGMRNNLITKNLRFTIDGQDKVAKWDHIVQLYEKNPVYKGLKIIKKLTENHCNAEKIPKMKVKYASQLFSQTVGKTMGYLAENGLLPEECTDTADFIIFMDNLFDSMNGSFKNSNTRGGKELLRNITPTSPHNLFWTKAKHVLRSMKFISTKGNAGTVPTITNWLRTIENMELLRDILFNKNIKSIWARHLNQDPLENFFGSIRSHGVRNTSPTCAAFEGAFASLLVNNLSRNYSKGSNCEDDTCQNFKCFEDLFFSNNDKNECNSCEIDINDILCENIITSLDEKKKDARIIGTLQYVAGYILRQCQKNIKFCENCKKEFIETDLKSSYLKCREYRKRKMSLTYPHENFVKIISEIQDVTHYILKNKSHINSLRNYIKIVLYTNINFNWIQCENHKNDVVEFVCDYTCRFLCNNWCRNVNKLLNGTSKCLDTDDVIQNLALEYCKKRKKNK